MNKIKTKKAFSIVEVLLVLAIAGLIMLAIFIALPALQRSKRNTQRKDDMARIMKAVASYQSAHNSRAPLLSDSGCASNLQCVKLDQNFVSKYVDDHVISVDEDKSTYTYEYVYNFTCDSDGCPKFSDPKGNPYKIVLERGFVKGSTGVNNSSSFDHAIRMVGSARCNTDANGEDFKAFVALTNDPNDVVITMGLEGGVYCVDNQ